MLNFSRAHFLGKFLKNYPDQKKPNLLNSRDSFFLLFSHTPSRILVLYFLIEFFLYILIPLFYVHFICGTVKRENCDKNSTIIKILHFLFAPKLHDMFAAKRIFLMQKFCLRCRQAPHSKIRLKN